MRTLIALLLLTISYDAYSRYGNLVIPEKVISRYQTVWGAIVLNDCIHRDKVTDKNSRRCDVTWDLLPDGASLSKDLLELTIPPLPQGDFIISGAINVYETDSSSKTHSIPFRSVISSEPLDVGFSLKGLPLDPFNSNEISLENDENRKHRCLFYSGVLVQTPIDKIEKNKLYCQLKWQNIPAGFSNKNKTNPTVFVGNLSIPSSENPKDFVFDYSVNILLPYENEMHVGKYSVDASKNVVSRPSISTDLNYSNSVFYTNKDQPLVPLKASFSNPYREQMFVAVTDSFSKKVIFNGTFYDGEILDTELDVSSLFYEPGTLHNLDLSVKYSSDTAEPANLAISMFDRGDKNPIKLDSVRFKGGDLLFDAAFAKPGYGTYRVYLSELTDISLNSDRDSDKPISAAVSDIYWTHSNAITISIPNNQLEHNRYVIVAELIGLDSNDRLKVIDRHYSNPIVHSIVSDKYTPNTITKMVAPVDSYLVINTTFSNGQPPLLKQHDKIISPTLGFYTLDNPGDYILGETDLGTHNNVSVYDIGQFRLAYTPESPSPNQPVTFYLKNLDGTQLDSINYTIYWDIDGVSSGRSHSLAHTFTSPGTHHVNAFIVNDLSGDTHALSGKNIGDIINVQLTQEKEEDSI